MHLWWQVRTILARQIGGFRDARRRFEYLIVIEAPAPATKAGGHKRPENGSVKPLSGAVSWINPETARGVGRFTRAQRSIVALSWNSGFA
jgi:hypothetical protein